METSKRLLENPLFAEYWDKTDYVCPVPADWSAIVDRLAQEYAKKHLEVRYYPNIAFYNEIGLPTPLILGGWIASDEHKKRRWIGAMVWAEENGLMWVIETTPFEKWPF